MRKSNNLSLLIILTCKYSILFFSLYGLLFLTACKSINSNDPVAVLPQLTTTEVTSITQVAATSGGNITSDGSSSVTARGVCWSTNANPTIADNKTNDGGGIGQFKSLITGLYDGTTYFVRAYATNSAGTGYGSAYQITTRNATSTLTDIEGNVYKTLLIGNQTWMVENLKTTKYKDGTAIPLVTDGMAWSRLTTAAYCFSNNDAANKNTYGALYNWYAVKTAKLAPAGWHVATDAEWTTLENYVSTNLGVSGTVAKALAATTIWTSSTNKGAIGNDLKLNNTSGFTALPIAERDYSGTFGTIGGYAAWWTSTEYNAAEAWYRNVFYTDGYLVRWHNTKNYGYSVRCVKD